MPGDYQGSMYGDYRFLPIFGAVNRTGEGDNAKLMEDRYEIYVNNDLVGNKTLLNQNDTLEDVDDFLKQQGIKNFHSSLEGDHYRIDTSDEYIDEIKNALSVYLNNR